MLTNNIPIISNRIKFSFNITVDEDFSKMTDSETRLTKTEVLAINLSNNSLDIRQYIAGGIVYPLQGYTLLFYRGSKKPIAYLEIHENLTKYSLAAAFHSQNKYSQGRYCTHSYVNSTSVIDVELNFDSGRLTSSINEQPCHSYRIDKKIFPENKATFSFMGYSSNVSPIQVKVNDLSIFKAINATDTVNSTFHADTNAFISSIAAYDHGYAKNVSLSNILLINVP